MQRDDSPRRRRRRSKLRSASLRDFLDSRRDTSDRIAGGQATTTTIDPPLAANQRQLISQSVLVRSLYETKRSECGL